MITPILPAEVTLTAEHQKLSSGTYIDGFNLGDFYVEISVFYSLNPAATEIIQYPLGPVVPKRRLHRERPELTIREFLYTAQADAIIKKHKSCFDGTYPKHAIPAKHIYNLLNDLIYECANLVPVWVHLSQQDYTISAHSNSVPEDYYRLPDFYFKPSMWNEKTFTRDEIMDVIDEWLVWANDMTYRWDVLDNRNRVLDWGTGYKHPALAKRDAMTWCFQHGAKVTEP